MVMADASQAACTYCLTRTCMLKALQRGRGAMTAGDHGVIIVTPVRTSGAKARRYNMKFTRYMVPVAHHDQLVAREVASVLKLWWPAMTHGGMPR